MQRNVFIVHALLSEATRSSSFLTLRSNRYNWQVSSVVGETVARVAFSVLLRSPVLAFRNGRDKELEVAKQWDLISHGWTTYTTNCYYYYYYYSSPSRFHVDDVDVSTRVLLCAHRGERLLNGVQFRPWKTQPRAIRRSFLFHPSLPSFGINVLAPGYN